MDGLPPFQSDVFSPLFRFVAPSLLPTCAADRRVVRDATRRPCWLLRARNYDSDYSDSAGDRGQADSPLAQARAACRLRRIGVVSCLAWSWLTHRLLE